MTDLKNAPQWVQGVNESKQKTEGPMRAGVVFSETRTIGGRTATFDIEVREFDAPRRYAAGMTYGKKRKSDFVYAFDLKSVGGTTEITMVAKGSGKGLKAALLLGMMMKSMEQADGGQLDRLKAAIEGATQPSDPRPTG